MWSMAVLILALSYSSSLEIDPDEELITQEDVDYINSHQSLWVASKKWIGSKTLRDLNLIGAETEIQKLDFPEYDWGEFLNTIQLPAQFDSRLQWPNCVTTIGDQGGCTYSGYAFALVASLGERYCINSSRFWYLNLSPQHLINCGSGCFRSDLNGALKQLINTGASVSTCIGYTGTQSSCSILCDNGTPVTPYKVSSVYTYSSPSSIQAAIYTSGPITSTMFVYRDFLAYTSGIYSPMGTGTFLYTQQVKILGWGVTAGTNYWVCSNSLGTTFGMNGYFNIVFGACGIDFNGVAGLPQI